jgi:two-component system, OmpR family, osmolarity sensor histidine kinase EnvZ
MRLLRTTYARVLALQLLTLLIMLFTSALCGFWFLSTTSMPLAKQAFAQLRTADALFNYVATGAGESDAGKAALTALTSGALIKLGRPPEEPNGPANAQLYLDKLRSDLAQLAGSDASARLSNAPDPRLWLRSQYKPQLWVGISVIGYRERGMQLIAWLMLAAFAVSMLAAMLIARVLARPLEQLAAQSNALVTGARDLLQIRNAPTEVQQLADAIALAGARAGQNQRERESMLAGISHDLRTPLARLRVALELGDADEAKRRAAMIGDIEEMDNIIAHCLSFVRDGSDQPQQSLALGGLLRELIQQSSSAAEWRLQDTTNASGWVLARPLGLKRALQNLMRNAETHAQPPFELLLACDHDGISLTILDRGPGIDTARLGTAYIEQPPAAPHKSTGYGLGLSIAERALQLDGAALSLANRNDGGLQVCIRFAQP